MLARIIIATFVLLMSGPDCYAKEIGGISFPETLEFSPARLILNGAGVRKKFFVKLYVGGLYLMEKSRDPQRIILVDEPMAIKLRIISALITSAKMEEATREGFEKATAGNIEPIRARVEKFLAVFREKIEINDTYDLVYEPGRGVAVSRNGELHTLIAGLDFKQALFGIWLGQQPAQESLKEEMLGQ